MPTGIRRSFLWAPAVVFLIVEPGYACPPPSTEVCDGIDNDGDTFVDEDGSPDAGEPALCSPGSFCLVAPGAKAQCAPTAKNGTFACSAGRTQVHEGVVSSATGEPITGSYCFSFDACGGCMGERCDEQGTPVCGMAPLPPCVCREDGRCRDACSGVTCPAGYACHETEPKISTCQPNGDCRIAGGCAPGEHCFGGACFPDPCSSKACAANQVCRGTKDGAFCETSCADVTCDQGTFCVRGSCYPRSGCNEVADANFCPALTVCRPDGNCGDPPCVGVRCPAGQVCVDDECRRNVVAADSSVPAQTPDASTPTADGAPAMPTGVTLHGISNEASGCGCSFTPHATNFGAMTLAAIVFALTRRVRGRRISLARTSAYDD